MGKWQMQGQGHTHKQIHLNPNLSLSLCSLSSLQAPSFFLVLLLLLLLLCRSCSCSCSVCSFSLGGLFVTIASNSMAMINREKKSVMGFPSSKKDTVGVMPPDFLLIKPTPTSELIAVGGLSAINIIQKQHQQQQQQQAAAAETTEQADRILLEELKIMQKQQGDHQFRGLLLDHHHDDESDHQDGFRTPTSMDHRIPMIPQTCPFAPKKPKATTPITSSACRKRKILSSSSPSSLNHLRLIRRRLDFFECTLVQTHLEDLGCKIKKIRGSPFKN